MTLVAGSYEKFIWGFSLKTLRNPHQNPKKEVGEEEEEEEEEKTTPQSSTLRPLFSYPSHAAAIKCVAVSGPVAVSGGADDTIKVYDLSSSSEIGSLTDHAGGGAVSALAFYAPPSLSFPRNLIAASDSGEVSIYDVDPFVHLKSVRAHRRGVNDVAVHPSGRLALTVGRDSCLAMVNLVRGRRSFCCSLEKEASVVRYGLDGGAKFYMAAEEKISVHDSEDAKLVLELNAQKRVLSVAPGENGLLFTGGDECGITAWDTTSGKVAYCIDNAHSARVKGLVVLGSRSAVQGSGTPYLIASASSDGVIRVWDVRMATKEKPDPLAETNTKSRLTCLAGSSVKSNHLIPGFVPPGYNALRTTLLQKERAHIERLLIPIKGTWGEKGVSIVSDGWTDAQKRPLINFMAASEGGPNFLKAIDGTKEYKDKHYIARLIMEVISEIGPQSVVQIITDNAPVMKSAGSLVEAEYPHIFWTPCVVHTLNLALKNISAAKNSERNEIAYGECHWITKIADDAVFIRIFIVNHSMRLAMFNEFSTLKLLAVAETRFASVLIMLKRLKLIKRSLQSMVISDEWSSYREDDPGKAQNVKEIILNDNWWDKVDYILSFTNPIYDMLRVADTDKPILHMVYDLWDSMIEKVKKAIFRYEGLDDDGNSSFYNVIHTILIDRWTKSCTPLHCMTHSLNPRYYSGQWLDEASNRVPPHKDEEICIERNKCLRRYFPDNEDRRKANVEFARFSGSMDQFGEYDCLEDRWKLEPKIWWYVYGSSLPLLQGLAFKLLGQPCSSSCCERNWSTYSFIHSMRRNKITPKRAEDLVFIHTNLRLLSRKSEAYTKGETKMWDIAGDAWDEPFGGAGMLEIANLSLDEPDMEAVMFTDDDVNVNMVGENDEE